MSLKSTLLQPIQSVLKQCRYNDELDVDNVIEVKDRDTLLLESSTITNLKRWRASRMC